MKYIDEFRAPGRILKIAGRIRQIAPKETVKIMEVCGTHTQNFHRFGLAGLLPETIQLISGPGCPVCVSPERYIDQAIALSRIPDVVILTFGDMLRVPGSRSSLENERAKGACVRLVYSPLEALTAAGTNPDKKIVFLGVGFETTVPTVALTILAAKKKKLKNLFFFTAFKLIPPAMRYLLRDKKLDLGGFLCPGHVSAIIGTRGYAFIAQKNKIPCAVAGFEPLDILEGIYLILRQIKSKKPRVANQYTRVVTKAGNIKAQRIIRRVFRESSASWRGLGDIPRSGLKLRAGFSAFDAEKAFPGISRVAAVKPAKGCRCADVLKGRITPAGCALFSKACRPDNPVGPCMVSSEGACNAYFKYK